MTPKPKTQAQKFCEAARELGTDDNENRFNKKLNKIAKQKPSNPKKSGKTKN